MEQYLKRSTEDSKIIPSLDFYYFSPLPTTPITKGHNSTKEKERI